MLLLFGFFDLDSGLGLLDWYCFCVGNWLFEYFEGFFIGYEVGCFEV